MAWGRVHFQKIFIFGELFLMCASPVLTRLKATANYSACCWWEQLVYLFNCSIMKHKACAQCCGCTKYPRTKKKKMSIRQWQLKMEIFMCVSNSSVKRQCFLRLNKPKEVYWARVEALERVKGLRQLTGEGKGRMTDRYKRVRERESVSLTSTHRGGAKLLSSQLQDEACRYGGQSRLAHRPSRRVKATVNA